jgi:hypothetical protein
VILKRYLQDTLGLSHRILTGLKARPDGILLNGHHVTVRAILHEGAVLSLPWRTPLTRSVGTSFPPLLSLTFSTRTRIF